MAYRTKQQLILSNYTVIVQVHNIQSYNIIIYTETCKQQVTAEQINILAYANLIMDTKPDVGLAYKNSLMDNCLPCVVARLLAGTCNCLWPINQCPVYHVVHVIRCCEGVTNL